MKIDIDYNKEKLFGNNNTIQNTQTNVFINCRKNSAEIKNRTELE